MFLSVYLLVWDFNRNSLHFQSIISQYLQLRTSLPLVVLMVLTAVLRSYCCSPSQLYWVLFVTKCLSTSHQHQFLLQNLIKWLKWQTLKKTHAKKVIYGYISNFFPAFSYILLPQVLVSAQWYSGQICLFMTQRRNFIKLMFLPCFRSVFAVFSGSENMQLYSIVVK